MILGGGVRVFHWSITVNVTLKKCFIFTLYISMTFSRFVRMIGNLLFFVSWFLDEVRFIKEVQKTSRPFWIYISIFTQPIWFIHFFLFFDFYCNIHNITNPIIDVYEVNNRRNYQCQSYVWTHMGIMRQKSIFKDINRLTIIWFTTRLTFINRNS